jgi:hypothetical protein
MAWLGLLPTVVLLAEFILAMEAVLFLLANFAGAVKTLVSRKLHEWKCT